MISFFQLGSIKNCEVRTQLLLHCSNQFINYKNFCFVFNFLLLFLYLTKTTNLFEKDQIKPGLDCVGLCECKRWCFLFISTFNIDIIQIGLESSQDKGTIIETVSLWYCTFLMLHAENSGPQSPTYSFIYFEKRSKLVMNGGIVRSSTFTSHFRKLKFFLFAGKIRFFFKKKKGEG